MPKHNLLIKNIKKRILSINDLIERSFENLKYFKSNYRKILLNKENRVILALGIVVILTLTYFLLPTFYNKNTIQTQIKNQILKNYNINIKFNEDINYSLLPAPHFFTKNLSIIINDKEVGLTKNLKIFIKVGKFFSINETHLKDLVFSKTDFNVSLEDFDFFKNLLKTEPHENRIIFKKSNIFFKNLNKEILFINKIKNGEFYYDSNKLQNVFIAKNEVFNVPYKLTIRNDKFNKNLSTIFNSKKIRLNVESLTSYESKIKNGLLDILLISNDTSLEYELKENSLTFNSTDSKNKFKGQVDYKPFYLSAVLNYDGISLKNFFNEKSIFVDLIDSEILNNKNLSANINFKIKDITNINELNKLNLNFNIEEGDISFSNSSIMWKEDLKILLQDTLLILDDDGIKLVGTIDLDFLNIKNFYSSFQIPKKNRKKVNKIKIDFVYNINNKDIRFNNPKIDNSQNASLEIFLDNFNSKENRVFNKITFKNFVNEFFGIYDG